MTEINARVATNFDTKEVEIEFLDGNGDLVHLICLPPQHALFLAEMLVSKSLNILEQILPKD